MDLTEALRTAAADPPPTSIDLDALIGRERRRERQQRWLSGAGVAAGLVVSFGVTATGLLPGLRTPWTPNGAAPQDCPSVSPGSHPRSSPPPAPGPSGSQPSDPWPTASWPSPSYPGGSGPSGSASPEPDPSVSEPVLPQFPGQGPLPSEACGLAQRRFNRALTESLHTVLPNATLVNAEAAEQPPVWFRHATEYLYATVVVTAGNKTGRLTLQVQSYARAPADKAQACPRPEAPCEYQVTTDGSVIVRTTVSFLSLTKGRPDKVTFAGYTGFDVSVYRPDGTLVAVRIERNPPLDPPNVMADEMPLSLDQLQTIATTPDFTLFP